MDRLKTVHGPSKKSPSMVSWKGGIRLRKLFELNFVILFYFSIIIVNTHIVPSHYYYLSLSAWNCEVFSTTFQICFFVRLCPSIYFLTEILSLLLDDIYYYYYFCYYYYFYWLLLILWKSFFPSLSLSFFFIVLFSFNNLSLS